MKIDKANRNPLYLSLIKINRVNKSVLLAMLLPIPFIAMATLALFYFEPKWYKDIFLASILFIFTIGQIKFLKDLITLKKALKKIKITINIVYENYKTKSFDQLKNIVIKNSSPSHIRDLIIKWINLLLINQHEGFIPLMDNAANKRMRTNDNILSFHIAINRTTLKMGFLGTLIGLLLTFPPMKSAILALKSSEGEFKFVNDIAHAIDGDQYAILTTLIATGFSIFIELITIRILENIVYSIEDINDYLDEWAISELIPLANNENKKNELNNKLGTNLDDLLHLNLKIEKQIKKMYDVEKTISDRIDKLHTYEEQYREFINTKTEASIPKNLKLTSNFKGDNK